MSWANVAMAVAASISAASAYQQNRNAKAVANYNADVAEVQAQDAITRGQEEAARVRRQYDQMAGQQRAGFAAKGLDIGEGSVADAIDQTSFFSTVDQNMVKQNAAREAWNLRARRTGYQYEASTYKPGQAALLAAGGTVASKWSAYKG